jgi:hypothetical protein
MLKHETWDLSIEIGMTPLVVLQIGHWAILPLRMAESNQLICLRIQDALFRITVQADCRAMGNW